MRFKKLVSKKQRKLEATDLKLIRAIEDIIQEQNILDKMPIQVQDLIAERQALRKAKEEDFETPVEPEAPESSTESEEILINVPEELIVNQEVEDNG